MTQTVIENNFFKWPIRVYYEDTDCAGHVYYANYLRFIERARTEWLRALDLSPKKLEDWGFILVVIEVDIKYHKSAHLLDELEVRSRVAENRKATFTCEQDIYRGDEKLISAKVKLACLDRDTHKPKIMPEKLIESLINLRKADNEMNNEA